MDDEKLEAIALDSLLADKDEYITDLEWPLSLSDPVDLLALSTDGGNALTTSTALTASTARGGVRALSTGKRRRTKQRDPNRARNERRLELVHLRRQAGELESRLVELKSGGRRFECTASDSQAECVMDAWREIANDMASERQRTERENIRLRLLVDNHAKITSQLRRIVMPKRPRYARSDVNYFAESPHFAEASRALAAIDDDMGCKNPSTSRRSPEISSMPREPLSRTFTDLTHAGEASARLDAKMFDRLMRKVDRARDEIDGIFTANGLAATNKAYRSAKVEQDEASGVNMELVASIVLPYDLEATQRVVWQHFSRVLPHMPDRTFFQYHAKNKDIDLIDPEDTDVATYSLELANGFVTSKFDEWRVMRRFVSPDRIIIIFCLVAETTEFASEPIEGIQVLEQAYIVLRQPGTSSIDGGSATLMQTCYHLQPVVTKPSQGSKRTLAQLTDFLFAFVAGTISVNHQMIERELEVAAR